MVMNLDLAAEVPVDPDSAVCGYIVAGLPPGTVFTHGSDNGNGTWSLSPQDARGVGLRFRGPSPDMLRLTVAVVDQDQMAVAMGSLNLKVPKGGDESAL